MGQQDYLTMTPGSAVADKLQEILMNKRIQAHQAQQDQLEQQRFGLDQQKFQADSAYRTENLETLRGQRRAMEDQRDQSIAKSKADMEAAATQRADDATRAQRLTALRSDPKFATMSPMEQWLALREALPKGEAPPAPFKPPQSADDLGSDIFTQDRDGNVSDSGVWAPKGAHVVTQPAPPQPTTANQPQLLQFSVPDPTDPTKTIMESHWLRPGEQPNDKNKINNGVLHKDRNIPVGKPAGPLVPTALGIAYAKSKGKATDRGGWFGGASAQDKAAFFQIENEVYSKFPSHVGQLAKEIITSEDPSTPIDDIVKNAVASGNVSPIEAPQLAELLTHVRQ